MPIETTNSNHEVQVRMQILDPYKFAPIIGDGLTKGLHRLMSVAGRVSGAYQVSGKFSTNWHLVGLFALKLYDVAADPDKVVQAVISKVWRVDPHVVIPAAIQEMNTTGVLPYSSKAIDQPSWQQVPIPTEWPTEAERDEWRPITVDINYSIKEKNIIDANGEPSHVLDEGHPMYHTHGDDTYIDVSTL